MNTAKLLARAALICAARPRLNFLDCIGIGFIFGAVSHVGPLALLLVPIAAGASSYVQRKILGEQR